MKEQFTGDRKNLDHFLLLMEQKVIRFLLPRVPPWMTTVNLTLISFLWAGAVILFGYLAAGDIRWLWGFSIAIILQHVSDMLDGAVGRVRDTGLIKWGFYMDHLLDYVFLAAIVIGYSFLLPLSYMPLVLMCLAVCAGFMIHVFLDFGITADMKISFNRFGVSEARWTLIILNTVLVFTGKELLVMIFPWFVAVAFAALAFVVYQSQKQYGRIDEIKKEKEGDNIKL